MPDRPIRDSAENGMGVVDGLFVTYYRRRFVSIVESRLSAYGLGILARGEERAASGDRMVREALNRIADAIGLSLGATETVVALFRSSERRIFVAGEACSVDEKSKPGLCEAIAELVRNGYSPALRTCNVPDSAGGRHPKVPEGTLIEPILIGDSVSGLIAASKTGEEGFSSYDEAKMMTAALVLGGAAQEITDECRSEERLRSLAHGLSAALDVRDPKTKGHSHRVAMYAMAILNEMGGGETDPDQRGMRNRIMIAALLHDIGKVGIPDSILLKEDKLSAEEYECIKQHSVLGAEIVTACSGLKDLVPGVLYHHEHFDGSGYPFGLAGEDIPLGARIIALADAFDAITSDRLFRKASTHEEAIEILEGTASKNFDPAAIEALIRAYGKGELEYVKLPSRSTSAGESSDEAVEKVYGRQLKSIPSLPHVLSTVNSLLDDPAASLREIASVLSTDEGLASRVLRLVNSAYYGIPRMVSTIPLATTILGADTIKSHVVNIAYADLMRALGGGRAEYDLLWRHALKTATWARTVASQLGDTDPEEAFTGGLVHDIGKALSLRLSPDGYCKLVREADKSGRPLLGVEEEVVGFEHTKMGAWAAGRWMLPPPLVNAVRWHHEPDWLEGECREIYSLVRAIHIADIAARASQVATARFTAFLLEELSPQVLRELGSAYFSDLESSIHEVEEAEQQLEETLSDTGVSVP